MSKKISQKKDTPSGSLAYVASQFICDNTAVIPIRISSPEMLYSSCDRNGLIMNDEIAAYIDKCMFAVPKRTPVLLLFCCAELSDTKKDAVKNLVKIHYGQKYEGLRRGMLKSLLFLICIVVIALLLVVAAFVVNDNYWRMLCMCSGVISFLVIGFHYIYKATEFLAKMLSVMKIYTAHTTFKAQDTQESSSGRTTI